MVSLPQLQVQLREHPSGAQHLLSRLPSGHYGQVSPFSIVGLEGGPTVRVFAWLLTN